MGKELMFLGVEPKRLQDSYCHWSDLYDIKTNASKTEILNVKNKEMGEIKYKAMKLDEGITNIKGTVHLWTNRFANVLNIFHMHVNDSSDEGP